MRQAAEQFLAQRRIAVTGVSRDAATHGGNPVYRRLKERGYEVFAINPNAESVEGDRAYASLSEVPGGVDAVVVATAPHRALGTVEEAARLGVRYVWMHRGPGGGSVSPEAAVYGREHGMTVLAGGCPLMFGPTSDGGHRFMCRMMQLTGALPRTVPEPSA